MSTSGVKVALGNGQGGFTAGGTYPASIGGQFEVVLLDVNGDGRLDAAVPSFTAVQVLLGNGNGTFAAGPTTQLPGTSAVSALSRARVNADARADLYAVDGASSTLFALRGNANGSFTIGGQLYAHGIHPGGRGRGRPQRRRLRRRRPRRLVQLHAGDRAEQRQRRLRRHSRQHPVRRRRPDQPRRRRPQQRRPQGHRRLQRRQPVQPNRRRLRRQRHRDTRSRAARSPSASSPRTRRSPTTTATPAPTSQSPARERCRCCSTRRRSEGFPGGQVTWKPDRGDGVSRGPGPLETPDVRGCTPR